MSDPVEARFFVPGEARPKGSFRILPRGKGKGLRLRGVNGRVALHYQICDLFAKDDASGLKAWTKAIQAVAFPVSPLKPVDAVPFEVVATFYYERPKSRQGEERKITFPDVDKLARALLDALTGVFWKDDAQVSDLLVRKRYGKPGADVRVVEVNDQLSLL